MAANKLLEESQLLLEVENGVDSSGDPKYTSKTLGSLRTDADPTDVLAIAEAVKNILSSNSRKSYIKELSALTKAE